MSSARIVTDSSAELPAGVVEELGITVVPLRVSVGAQMLVDGPELRSCDFYRRMLKDRVTPAILAPTPQRFAQVYNRLARETHEKIAITVCKRASIKGGQVLTQEEMRELVRQLEATTAPRTCPHGRPTMIHLSAAQLAREFGRM